LASAVDPAKLRAVQPWVRLTRGSTANAAFSIANAIDRHFSVESDGMAAS
jgi:hypothetical protein